MMRIVPAARPLLGEEERSAVERVMLSGMVAQGPEVAAFETEFSTIVGGRHCVAVNSGTSALHLSLLALGIGAGDEVIVPSFSFAATANAVALTGATPVFADIDRDSFCISPDAVAAAITRRTVAVLPVHLYGHPAAMTQIMRLAQRHSLAVVEDAAQAHGAALGGRNVGEFGHAAGFSFYPTKNMTSGEGGMVVTPDEEVARKVRLLRNQGMEARYQNEIVGLNNRMTDIHAAIGRVQLRKLAGWNEQRRQNARILDEGVTGVDIPVIADAATHVYHQYTVRTTSRDRLHDKLAARGIASAVYYPTPIHRLPSYNLTLDLPETEAAAREVLSLPVHPALTDEDLRAVIEAVAG